MISAKLFVMALNFKTFVRYHHEVYLIKCAKPNQATCFVHYNRVIVITEFDCTVEIGSNDQSHNTFMDKMSNNSFKA